MIDDSTGGKHV